MEWGELPSGWRDFSGEFSFQASRSSGAGGQHVNKVSSRVELRFNIPDSALLQEEEKQLLLQNLASKLTKEGHLLIACEESRSQIRNKRICIKKFYTLLNQALQLPKQRKPTRPSVASRQKRLDEKRRLGSKKALRKPPEE